MFKGEKKLTKFSLSDERCPEGPWSCCEPKYATTGIDGQDTEAAFTVEDTAAAAGTNPAFTAQELYHPLSWDDHAAVHGPFISESDDRWGPDRWAGNQLSNL